jgi:hypothetical protein
MPGTSSTFGGSNIPRYAKQGGQAARRPDEGGPPDQPARAHRLTDFLALRYNSENSILENRNETMPRTVHNNLLVSESLPAIKIRVDRQFTYAGTTSFILYEIAHAEQHHFVVAGAGKRVERLLWFQFEGYLDTNEHTYRYPPMETMTLGGLTFLHDGDALNLDEAYRERPTSDSAHVVDFLKGQGYSWEGDTMFKRMVWLDENRRNELMIIYSEDLSLRGFQRTDLRQGDSHTDKWSSVSAALHERALGSFAVEA